MANDEFRCPATRTEAQRRSILNDIVDAWNSKFTLRPPFVSSTRLHGLGVPDFQYNDPVKPVELVRITT